MWVAANDIEVVLDWFYRKSNAPFLGLFVAGDQKFNKFLESVIKDRSTIDVISGSSIDLVLLSEGEVSIGDSPVCHISKVRKWDPKFNKGILQATSMSTNQIAHELGVGVDGLPGLILIGKRSRRSESRPKLNLPLRGAEDASFLIDFLRAFRLSMERMTKAKATTILRTELWMEGIENNAKKLLLERTVIQKRDLRIQTILQALSQFLSAQGLQALDLDCGIMTACDLEAFLTLVSAQYRSCDTEKLNRALAEPDAALMLKRLSRAQTARRSFLVRTRNLLRVTPPVSELERIVELTQAEVGQLEAVIRKHSKLSYNLHKEDLFSFLTLSEKFLGHLSKVVKILAAIKTGGASLL